MTKIFTGFINTQLQLGDRRWNGKLNSFNCLLEALRNRWSGSSLIIAPTTPN